MNTAGSLKGRKCIVTGAAGFIGSHLCARLRDAGAEVVAVDLTRNTQGSLYPLLNGDAGPFITADLGEVSSIERVCDMNPHYVFHLAGRPYAPWTSRYPAEAFQSNVASTANMIEVSRRTQAHFLLASSACFFGAATSSPLHEHSPLSAPEHYYTHTKRQAEATVHNYHEFYGTSSTICRFVNVYGPGDRHFGRIVPWTCRELIVRKVDSFQFTRSAGESTFEFLHVLDAVEGLLRAAESATQGVRTFHFGPGEHSRIAVRELVRLLSRLYDGCDRPIHDPTGPYERPVSKFLAIEQTQEELGWSAAWRLEEGLRQTLDWYRVNIAALVPSGEDSLMIQ